jgi:hypothetical protein
MVQRREQVHERGQALGAERATVQAERDEVEQAI